MKRMIEWFNYKASLRAKILICITVLQGIVLFFFGCYVYSVQKLIITRMAADEAERIRYMKEFLPARVSCILVAIFMMMVSFVIADFLISVVIKRLKRLTHQADGVATGDLEAIPKTDAMDEIGVVTNSISVMAENLKERAAAAKAANSTKTDFLARMSHDIRTPMNAIHGMVEIIKKNPEDKKRVKDCIRKIDISTSHMIVLIDEILDMSKLDNGDMDITTESFDIGEVLQQSLDFAVGQAEERDISVYMDSSDLTVTKVVGCELYTRRIFTNLLSNAIKFNKDNGSVSIEVNENVIDKRRVVYTFSIEDSGIGMSRDFINNAFEPFAQENKGSGADFSGTGLGLAIVKKLVEAMGGRIDLKSEVGEGTRLTFSLPFAIDKKYAGTDEEIAEHMKSGLKGSHMLLVEDNQLNLEIAKFMLEDKEIIVDTAVNGEEAIKLFEKSAPFTYDLILMDIMMPVMDGVEATKVIRNMTRADAKIIPIVALSANTYAEDIKISRDAGMDDHLGKPIDVERLYEVITRLKKLYDAKRIERPYSQLFTGDSLK
ncbi:MAG: response regulator [Lachnospiraceae bacterium]|nr:response regulator [Lachnospiraceae bacterium]